MYSILVFITNIETKLWTPNRAQQIVKERTSFIIVTLLYYIITYLLFYKQQFYILLGYYMYFCTIGKIYFYLELVTKLRSLSRMCLL